jgi:branched-chain amino acid aminotransferase
VFLVRGEQLLTPSITSGILESITRDTILTLAHDRGINIEQRPIDRTELYAADEVFFAGTAAEIIPIINIDGLAVDGGQVGRVTRDIQGAYFGTVEGRDEKWARWLLPVTDTN